MLERLGRSKDAWDKFLKTGKVDLSVLGANKRLDLVVRHPTGKTIGIEVECLVGKTLANALIIGIGQAVLALGHRDRVLLVVHCGKRPSGQRKSLRRLGRKIFTDPRIRMIVVP
ncbi:MAG: hypothetical protein A3I00_08805 [Betaproteobacteria bacterium RIFCSPLOWO2_02_FULL_64_12]|nr:MAG: hypothetical protein A3I00_08805 [Betaproteobacteria bacterium RIFCSPLOWO2_02_FULL_64_12]OGA96174.1 MAG: hypothetical protein A3G27_19480 [Betaproteobacteria bacterium RIFCSPLOWO2_12_FULL_66_14]